MPPETLTYTETHGLAMQVGVVPWELRGSLSFATCVSWWAT